MLLACEGSVDEEEDKDEDEEDDVVSVVDVGDKDESVEDGVGDDVEGGVELAVVNDWVDDGVGVDESELSVDVSCELVVASGLEDVSELVGVTSVPDVLDLHNE